MGAGELAALAIMVVGLAFGAVLIGRLLDRVERAIRMIEDWQTQVRQDLRRLDERVDETHRTIGRLDVIHGGKGRTP